MAPRKSGKSSKKMQTSKMPPKKAISKKATGSKGDSLSQAESILFRNKDIKMQFKKVFEKRDSLLRRTVNLEYFVTEQIPAFDKLKNMGWFHFFRGRKKMSTLSKPRMS